MSCYVVNIQGTGNYLLELSEDIELGPVAYKDDLLLVEHWRPGECPPRDSCDSLKGQPPPGGALKAGGVFTWGQL